MLARRLRAFSVRDRCTTRASFVPGVRRRNRLLSSCFEFLVMKGGPTFINLATTLTGTPSSRSKSVRAIKIIICGPVTPRAFAWKQRRSSRHTLIDLISHVNCLTTSWAASGRFPSRFVSSGKFGAMGSRSSIFRLFRASRIKELFRPAGSTGQALDVSSMSCNLYLAPGANLPCRRSDPESAKRSAQLHTIIVVKSVEKVRLTHILSIL